MKRRVFGSYTDIFEKYDKRRRERDFLRLKEMCEFKFGIDNVWTDSFQIPIFDKNGEKLFAIQMLLNKANFRVAIYFNNSKMLSEFDREYGAYTKYVLTISELYEQMENLIFSMYKFLGKKELYFSDYPED